MSLFLLLTVLLGLDVVSNLYGEISAELRRYRDDGDLVRIKIAEQRANEEVTA